MANARIQLSEISSDPEIAAFFARGEDGSSSFAVPATPEPVLTGGEAAFA